MSKFESLPFLSLLEGELILSLLIVEAVEGSRSLSWNATHFENVSQFSYIRHQERGGWHQIHVDGNIHPPQLG